MSGVNDPVKWLRHGFEISSNDKRFEPLMDGHVLKLIIKDVRLDDHGQYTCVAGEAQTSAILFVEGTPVMEFRKRISLIQILGVPKNVPQSLKKAFFWTSGTFL